MKTIENAKEFNHLVEQNKPVFIDFYADWCGPCQGLLPVVEKLAKEYDETVEVRKVNVDINPELAANFKVRSIPALFFIKNQKIVDHVNGAIPETELRTRLDLLIQA